jgi:ABC-type phosphate/phosphonate transport system substrate-binding protein
MQQRRALWLTLVLALGLASSSAAGQAQDFVFCYPGKPGNQQAAKNVMDTFAEYVARKAGFDVKVFTASYFNEEKPAVEFVTSKKPSFGILSVGLYLKWRKEGRKLEVLAQSERRGQTSEQYHVFVPAGSARKTLADLKGGVVVSDHLQDDAFATRIVFAGALDASKDVAVVSTRDPLRALKLCAKKKPMADGRAIDAVVLDDDQVLGMKDLPELKQLEKIWSSRPLPTPPVVSFSDNASKEDGKKLAAALLGMTKDDEGKRILETLLATGFNPAAPEAYATVEKEY